jgi:hypothetical protein
MWAGIFSIPSTAVWYLDRFPSIHALLPTWGGNAGLTAGFALFVTMMVANAVAHSKAERLLANATLQTITAGQPSSWSRLSEAQIDALAQTLTGLNPLRVLKMLILPRTLPDCEDLARDILTAALKAGWTGSESREGTYAGLAGNGCAVVPASEEGLKVAYSVATRLTLLLQFPVDSTTTLERRGSLGEDLQLRIGRRHPV